MGVCWEALLLEVLVAAMNFNGTVSDVTLGGWWVMAFWSAHFEPKSMNLLDFSTGSVGSTRSSSPMHTPTAKA